MPLPIQVGSVTQALQRAFGFKGRFTPLLDEVIVPVYVISDPTPAQVTRLVAASVSVLESITVGDISFVQLLNPAESGILINLTSAVASGTIKFRVIVELFDTPGAAESPAFFRDTRNLGSPSGQLRFDSQTTGFVGDIIAVLEVDGALTQTASWQTDAADPRQPLVVLKPGKGVIFQMDLPGGASVEELRVNLRWLEVPIWDIGPEAGLP